MSIEMVTALSNLAAAYRDALGLHAVAASGRYTDLTDIPANLGTLATATLGAKGMELLASSTSALAIDALGGSGGKILDAMIAGMDAAKLTGTIDPARLPVIPSGEQVISSGDFSALTIPQQDAIGKGTLVTTTDGRRWVYTGTGSKTDAGSYIELSDTTPDWSVIANKPANITAIAALTSAADKVPYATGAGTWALMDVTAAGRALLGAADAPAQRTALSLGTAAVKDIGVANGVASLNTDAKLAHSHFQLRETVGNGLDPVLVYRGFSEINGVWTISAATTANVEGYMRITATGLDPIVLREGLSIDGAANRYVALRYRIMNGARDGGVYWATTAHPLIDGAYRAELPADGGDGVWQTAVLDMWNPALGGTGWKDSTVTALRIDFASEIGAVADIAWIAVCADRPSLSTADVGYSINKLLKFGDFEGQVAVLAPQQLVFSRAIATSNDAVDFNFIRKRTATGGTVGNVNTLLSAVTYLDAASSDSFEWTATIGFEGHATGNGEHAALYVFARKHADSKTWSLASEFQDFVANPTKASVGYELGFFPVGTDNNNQRVALHLAFQRPTGTVGDTNEITYGIWCNPNSNTQVKYGLKYEGKFGVGVDLIGMDQTYSIRAINLSQNTYLSWYAGGTLKGSINWNSTNNTFAFYGAKRTTGAGGTIGAVVDNLIIDVDGTQYAMNMHAYTP